MTLLTIRSFPLPLWICDDRLLHSEPAGVRPQSTMTMQRNPRLEPMLWSIVLFFFFFFAGLLARQLHCVHHNAGQFNDKWCCQHTWLYTSGNWLDFKKKGPKDFRFLSLLPWSHLSWTGWDHSEISGKAAARLKRAPPQEAARGVQQIKDCLKKMSVARFFFSYLHC